MHGTIVRSGSGENGGRDSPYRFTQRYDEADGTVSAPTVMTCSAVTR